MSEGDTRIRAGQTAIDGFNIVERLYRHTYQVLMALKDKLKDELNLRVESPFYNSSIATSDPASWIFRFRGLYLAASKMSLEEYGKLKAPLLFLQASLHNSNSIEPLLRYGVIEKILNMSAWKNIRFDDYFRMIMAELHADPNPDPIRASHCEAVVHFDEKPLLDIREDSEVVDLAREIGERYGELMLK